MTRRIARVLVLTLLGTLAALALPRTSLACSCIFSGPREDFARADVIFRGTVLETEQPSWWQTLVPVPRGDVPEDEARLRVDAVWKGAPPSEVVVAAGPGTCGITFTPGVEYVVYGRDRGEGTLATGVCEGTISTDHVAEVAALLPALGPATPVAASALASENARFAADRASLPLLLAGAGLAAAGGLAFRRRWAAGRDRGRR